MLKHIIFHISLAYIFAFLINSSNGQPGTRCNNPGGSTKWECNTCGCSPLGYTTMCTLMGCPGYKKNQLVGEDKVEPGAKCSVPGDRKNWNCNTCICMGSYIGYSWACTNMACQDLGLGQYYGKRSADESDEKREISDVSNEVDLEKCPRGRDYFDGCNWCHCDGSPYGDMCTLKACPPY